MFRTSKPKLASLALLAAAGCALPQMSAEVPDKLQPAANESLAMIVPAKGVQIYECRASKGGDYEWAFVAPDAELYDTGGNRIGKHYAGPVWEAADGSKIEGRLKERADSPAGAIPWLLLTAKSVGAEGSFAKVTSIQRVRTTGGVAPGKDECSKAWAGTRVRIDYTADYHFFSAN